ncbi:NfeD family protein [Sphingobium sp. HBC34]|uniref:NfeD family protein n=1 Tax=Sphingobium cyanobacteriorum TaxID=3063954 RepID=A0ABT8ZHX8_9SPHN|nr:NfeD family protein [Sphingobium sp. HBC34]MDO7834031.1 NfeD family protein [Sphingobium sp. HBC34]
MTLSLLQDHWGWLVFAALLGIAEVMIPGVFLIWIAIAAAITGLVALALPIALPLQFLLFAGLSIAAVYAGRRWYVDNPVASTDPLLNDRTARLIGQTVTVVEPIVGGEGRVKVGDGVWSATGPDAAVGARVRVVAADGAVLQVEGLRAEG